jgi:CMP-N,N'-diacetyllegionaminic acid synthase
VSLKRTVALIPARGGSKTIKNKNIRIFEGKPLIAWTIECAKAAKGVDRVIVSTDSEQIARISLEYGAEVPFIRPEEISRADTSIEPVMAHAYNWLQSNGEYRADCLLLLFPTNPLRETRHIEDVIELFYSSGSDSVVSVNESPAHYTPYWTMIRNEDGAVTYFNGQDIRTGYTRRQDFPRKCYAKNDLVFAIKPQNLFAQTSSLYGERVEFYITDRIFDGDINTNEDWELTLLAFRHLASEKK